MTQFPPTLPNDPPVTAARSTRADHVALILLAAVSVTGFLAVRQGPTPALRPAAYVTGTLLHGQQPLDVEVSANLSACLDAGAPVTITFSGPGSRTLPALKGRQSVTLFTPETSVTAATDVALTDAKDALWALGDQRTRSRACADETFVAALLTPRIGHRPGP